VTLVVFDLDDTLYLEADFVRSGFAAVEATLRVEGLAATAWLLHESGQRGTVLTEALLRHDREPTTEEVRRAVAVYRCHTPRIGLAPDADTALRVFASDPSVELALLTDGDAVTQRNKIEALGLADRIGRIMITDELGPDRTYWKPHPEAFRLLQGGVRPCSTCVYIADNPRKDFDAPVQLGWHTVRLRRHGGLWEKEPDGRATPETTLGDLAMLPECVRSLVLS
jgi:putative hydrolase of the HAD superfamily